MKPFTGDDASDVAIPYLIRWVARGNNCSWSSFATDCMSFYAVLISSNLEVQAERRLPGVLLKCIVKLFSGLRTSWQLLEG